MQRPPFWRQLVSKQHIASTALIELFIPGPARSGTLMISRKTFVAMACLAAMAGSQAHAAPLTIDQIIMLTQTRHWR
jgi:hypothetical protein